MPIIPFFVDTSCRHARVFVCLCLLFSLICGWFTATHLGINTDTNALLTKDLPWRQNEAIMEKAFPQFVDTILVVVDGPTIDAADYTANQLANAMRTRPDLFTRVVQPDAIPYFQKNGLLFLDIPTLTTTLDQIVSAQPMLGSIVADPSLRGYFSTLRLMAIGAEQGLANPHITNSLWATTNSIISSARQGVINPLPWQSLMAGSTEAPSSPPTLRDRRKLILATPVLDYTALEPGKKPSQFIRDAAASLTSPTLETTVRLTGSVPLSDEELSSVADGTGFATALSTLLVIAILWGALKSIRLIIPIMLTLFAGLIITLAFAALTVGDLNMISVAFAVMFIGIAVDFGIQFGVRYRDQRTKHTTHPTALHHTAHVIATPLSLAAGATALGFLAFLPTDYRGVSELGLIAGAGMIIAFVLNITLLPALLTLFTPSAEREAVGFTSLAPWDTRLQKHRKGVISFFVVLTCLAGLSTTQLRFDFDPLNLKNPQAESTSTLFELMNDPDFEAYTLDILRPSLAEAEALANRLRQLPTVDQVRTLSSFVPEDQEEKLALIQDTAMLLAPTFALSPTAPPNQTQTLQSAYDLADALAPLSTSTPTASHLSSSLRTLRDTNIPILDQSITAILASRMQQIKTLLSTTGVHVTDISPDLRQDWVTAEGFYRIQVHPKGLPRDSETLHRFTADVLTLAPDATGAPLSIQQSAATIIHAFTLAGFYAVLCVSLLVFGLYRRLGDVVRMIIPLFIASLLTLGTMPWIGLSLNFANIIALPLLLSLGVSYTVYVVAYWRAGHANPLQSSMARAVFFSAATTMTAFGSLSLSHHLGTASMGKLLTIALIYCLLTTFVFLPSLLGCPKTDKHVLH